MTNGLFATHISSNGEIKISLKLMTCQVVRNGDCARTLIAHIFVSQMLKKLQFAVCSFGQDGGAEGLHNLLDCHGLAGELVFRRTALMSVFGRHAAQWQTYQTRPKAPMPTGCRSVYLQQTSVQRVLGAQAGCCAPACYLERRAEDLGAHKFSHGGSGGLRACNGRWVE